MAAKASFTYACPNCPQEVEVSIQSRYASDTCPNCQSEWFLCEYAKAKDSSLVVVAGEEILDLESVKCNWITESTSISPALKSVAFWKHLAYSKWQWIYHYDESGIACLTNLRLCVFGPGSRYSLGRDAIYSVAGMAVSWASAGLNVAAATGAAMSTAESMAGSLVGWTTRKKAMRHQEASFQRPLISIPWRQFLSVEVIPSLYSKVGAIAIERVGRPRVELALLDSSDRSFVVSLLNALTFAAKKTHFAEIQKAREGLWIVQRPGNK
jgi:hypothetical protein